MQNIKMKRQVPSPCLRNCPTLSTPYPDPNGSSVAHDSFEPSSAAAPRVATHILAQASNSDVFITTKLTVKCQSFSAQIPIFCSCLLGVTIFGNGIPSCCWKNNHCLLVKSQFGGSWPLNPDILLVQFCLIQLLNMLYTLRTYVFTLQMKRWLGNL